MITLFKKGDPLIYMMRDIGRVLMLVGLFASTIIAYVYVKPVMAKLAVVQDNHTELKVETEKQIKVLSSQTKENHESIAKLETKSEVNSANNKSVNDKLDDMSNDIDTILQHILKN